MLSASALGSADNTYLNFDHSGYHKNLIQQLFKIIIHPTRIPVTWYDFLK